MLSVLVTVRYKLCEDDGQKDQSLDAVAEFNGNQSAVKAESTTIKTDEQDSKKRKRSQSSVDHVKYDWKDAIFDHKNDVRRLGIVELPTNQVGRVMQSGRLVGLYHIESSFEDDSLQFNRQKNFIMFDGLEVLARVTNLNMKWAIYRLARVHIGRHCKWPSREILANQWNDEGIHCDTHRIGGGGWAFHWRPAAYLLEPKVSASY
ncbi:hypothetical protein PG994_001010 [Apiospora phragmitis]|uniref:Uncharacterized protein n=1 Tax=Apiospora phragmitis TaxID=2905665 RepID=A0ABR1WR78_9PEZI